MDFYCCHVWQLIHIMYHLLVAVRGNAAGKVRPAREGAGGGRGRDELRDATR